MQQPDATKSTRSDAETTMNIAMFLVHVYATPPELLLHRRLGERYYGMNTLGVVLAILFHAYLFRGYDVDLLMSMIPCYLLVLFAQRLFTFEAKRRGLVEHSYYSGYPIFLGKRSRMDEVTFKTWVEPFLVAAVGLFYLSFNQPAGSFILTCGLALRIKMAMASKLHRSRLLDMHDALIEQQIRAERFRQTRSSTGDALHGRRER